MAEAVIVAGARTPIGKLSGALAGFSAMELGGFAIAEALKRAGVSPDQVDYVLMGQVLQAGQGQITARQAAVHAGIPMSVPANTINKVCLSGLHTIYLADQMIRAGDADIVVAGGMESMTQAPYLLPGRPGRLPHRRRRPGRLDDVRRPDRCLRPHRHGPVHRALQREGGDLPGAPGRLLRRQPREGGRGGQGRPPGRGDRPGAGPPAQRRPAAGRRRRGRAARHHGRVAGRAAARLRQERAPSPPATPRRSPTAAPPSSSCRRPRPRSWASPAGPDRQLRHGGRPRHLAPDPALAGHRQGGAEGRHRARRHRPLRDQRGVRRRRPGLGRRSGHRRETRSTSTVVPSRSATRSACRAPGWR